MFEVDNLLRYFLQLRLMLVFDLAHFLVELLLAGYNHLLLIRMHFLGPFETLYELFAKELQGLLGVPMSRLLLLALLIFLLLENCL